MVDERMQDVHELADQLARALGRLGLVAERRAPTRVWASHPGDGGLSETVTYLAEDDGRLYLVWSWNERIDVDAADADAAARAIANVVKPGKIRARE